MKKQFLIGLVLAAICMTAEGWKGALLDKIPTSVKVNTSFTIPKKNHKKKPITIIHSGTFTVTDKGNSYSLQSSKVGDTTIVLQKQNRKSQPVETSKKITVTR